ncbi:sushi, von Willebrand factor type A, EGF and pentraxin domain-containing protein 1-like [Mercenaria mercenaria]|uniref:sushi, von Willebrand factor type A, EGF and pentraxin domain-containing protein 1-like n=1 Tax=Mercenaria mercenaria TaxID=6596 RepID=UPI00234EF28A|nr:sushi, von Willebrand factor type A, EGF and pentraxin domain-containing protein 1-like [Mercenaria mercenaria]
MTCEPPVIYVTAEPFLYVAKATWKEPMASDETDGSITPRRKSGYPPGSNFPEGSSRVKYEAKDRSGNRAACHIDVNVKVVRCDTPKDIQNGYYQCYPVTEFLNGGSCRFGCYEGFDLQGGQEVLHCQKNGKWSGPQPTCNPWKCPALPSLEGAGRPKCTNGSNFRSICSYNCGSGFDMPPRVSKALVCDKTKSWRKYGQPKCVDVEPPVFKPGTCPSIVISGTDTGLNSTKVSWTQPEVNDNSKKASRYMKHGYPPGTRLTAGIYSVQYGARDDAGNIAINDCSFQVIVREIRCFKLYPTPFVHIDCPHGYRTGARCDISCDPGKILNGSNDVGCNKSPAGLYGEWNWKGGQQTVCKNGRACVTIPPPKNGAVVCDNWEEGQYCQVQCKNGTQMSSVSLKKLYVCKGNGEWSEKTPTVKTCRAVHGHRVPHYIGIEASYYFDGDCTDPATQQEIASNFVAAVKASLYQLEACPDSIECNSRNVQISCGATGRKKRDTHSRNIFVLTANLPVRLHGNESLYKAETRYSELLESTQKVLNDNENKIFGGAAVSQKQFMTTGLQILCPIGSVKSEQSLDCIDCPEGTYYVSGPGPSVCEACRKGTYQDKAAQLRCIRCPVGTTTHSVGASSVKECKEACKPGTYSRDGLKPCSPCEQGQYQSFYGQTFCRSCQGSKSTLTFGAMSVSNCEEFDIEMVTNEQSNIHITLRENVTIKDFTVAFWFKRSASNFSIDDFPTVQFSDKGNEVLWVWEGLKKVKRHNTIDTEVNFAFPDLRWHYITLHNSPLCKIAASVDGMPLPVEDYTGGCRDMTFNTFSIHADTNTSGSISQLNVWRGKYTADNRHRCFSSEVGDILSWKTMEEAEIVGAYMHIPSQCDDFDNCVSSPCLHGMCTDALQGFTCTCEQGYLGTQCDINIDDCETNICMNNAICIDGVANYSCQCPADYTGQYCEIEMVDGGWSEWGNWSECSTTCGDGEKKRKRLCNSPSPDNGGEMCSGDGFDFTTCNNSNCPVCPQISAPMNGSLECVNDTESINCTVSCDDGFDFDIEPLPLYYCGPDTFQEWNYQTDENPERRLPKCVAIKLPKELKVVYSAHYMDLYCANEDLEDLAREQIDITVNIMLSNVPCLQKKSCSLNYVNVIDCDSKSRRRRSDKTVGFSLQIRSNPTEDDKNETLADLENAFQNIQRAADDGEFTVQVLDDDYELNSNITELHGEVVCGPGQTKVKFYCVPCGKGSYLYTDYCKPCPVGTFQEAEGHSSCTDCPKGKSTVGIRSTSISECTVDVLVSIEEGLKVTGIVVGCVCALVVIVTIMFVYRRYKSKQAKQRFDPTSLDKQTTMLELAQRKSGKDENLP